MKTLDTKQIAELLGVTRAHVTDHLTKLVGFPRPAIDYSQRVRRWDEAEVLAYFTQRPQERVRRVESDSTL